MVSSLASFSPLKIICCYEEAKEFNFLNLLGGHPISKYCVCFIVAPQQVSLLILSLLTAEKNQGTHFIITLQVRTQHLSVKPTVHPVMKGIMNSLSNFIFNCAIYNPIPDGALLT